MSDAYEPEQYQRRLSEKISRQLQWVLLAVFVFSMVQIVLAIMTYQQQTKILRKQEFITLPVSTSDHP